MEIPEKEYLESLINPLKESLVNIRKENKDQHSDIIEHQKITNGRVNRLETWKDRILGGTAVISILYGIALFLVGKYF